MAVHIIGRAHLPAGITDQIDPQVLETMLAGLNARAVRVAPCLHPDQNPPDSLLYEARLVLLSALQRFADVGAGALTQVGTGAFQVTTDTRQRSGYNLWPSEIATLQDLCKQSNRLKKAFNVPLGAAQPTAECWVGGRVRRSLSGPQEPLPHLPDPVAAWKRGADLDGWQP